MFQTERTPCCKIMTKGSRVSSSPIEHESLGISRSSIRPDIIPTKLLLHPYPPCLVKVHSSLLHQPLYLHLGVVVQSCPRITCFDVLGEVEVGAAHSSFHVATEGCRHAGIALLSERTSDRVESLDEVEEPIWDWCWFGDVGDLWRIWYPIGAGDVKYCRSVSIVISTYDY